jgi:hypothetical protein
MSRNHPEPKRSYESKPGSGRVEGLWGLSGLADPAAWWKRGGLPVSEAAGCMATPNLERQRSCSGHVFWPVSSEAATEGSRTGGDLGEWVTPLPIGWIEGAGFRTRACTLLRCPGAGERGCQASAVWLPRTPKPQCPLWRHVLVARILWRGTKDGRDRGDRAKWSLG